MNLERNGSDLNPEAKEKLKNPEILLFKKV